MVQVAACQGDEIGQRLSISMLLYLPGNEKFLDPETLLRRPKTRDPER